MKSAEIRMRCCVSIIFPGAADGYSTRFLLLADFSHALRRGKHQRDCIHILRLDFPWRNPHVREIFELYQQIDQRHRVDQSRGNQRSGLVDQNSWLPNQLGNVLGHLLRFRAHAIVSSDSALSSGCSRSNFSRVVERAAFPAVLFTIHLGGFRKMLRTDTPRPTTTRRRISCSISAAWTSSSSDSSSATTTMSSVPRSGLYKPIAIARPS